MTTGSDYPDYQSYANWRGPLLANESSWELSSSNPFTAAGYVTNYASLIAHVTCNSSTGLTVAASFYTDNTLTTLIDTINWILPPGAALSAMIPALGNYVAIGVSTSDATAEPTVIAIFATSTNVTSPKYFFDQNYVSGFDVSIPASTTEGYNLPYVSSGKCSIHFQDLSASGKVSASLWTINAAGTRQDRLYNTNNSTGVNDVTLEVPSVPLQLEVDNTDTSAHSVDYYCCVNS